jgi:hypothetical protein
VPQKSRVQGEGRGQTATGGARQAVRKDPEVPELLPDVNQVMKKANK